MGELNFIHADAGMAERGMLWHVRQADMEIDQSAGAELISNTWSLTIAEPEWEADPIEIGHFIYAPGTEWGGPVTNVLHSTEEATVTLQGPTWRGLLFQRRIEPPAGSAYLVLNRVDANEAIRTAIGSKYGSLFSPEQGTAGIVVSAQWRYQTVAGGLHSVLRSAGARLKLSFDNVNATVKVSAESVNDLTDIVEISQDYGVNFTSQKGNIEYANHCLALGNGQLEERAVLNVYFYNGQYYTARPADMQEEDLRTVLLDYPNAEDADELLTSAIERLQEKSLIQSIKIDSELIGLDAQLGDIIAVRDRLTGMAATSEVVRKILTIQDARLSISTEVG